MKRLRESPDRSIPGSVTDPANGDGRTLRLVLPQPVRDNGGCRSRSW